ncbi:hypothetical protein I4U23_016117 [Adineta vaga]|nr:hypothetical protein I4U23_016117 [Adineta vaga]
MKLKGSCRFLKEIIGFSQVSDRFRRDPEPGLLILAKETKIQDEHIFSFMYKKFTRWTGLKTLNKIEIQEEKDSRMRSQCFHPIENFPDKNDQLLEGIDKVY